MKMLTIDIRPLIALSVLAAAFAAIPASTYAAAGAGQDARADAQEVKREWAEAVRALKGYSAAQKDQALAKGREMLDAMDARIDRMELRAGNELATISRAARQKRGDALRALRKRRNEAAEWYGSMKQSSQNAWGEVRQGFVTASEALAKSFEDAAAAFEDDTEKKR